MIPGKPHLDLGDWQKRPEGALRSGYLERGAMEDAARSRAHLQK